MKKLLFILTFAIVANVSMAQSNVVASAYGYLKNGMPDKAKDEIDKAILNETSKAEAKTWFYRGNIYLQLFTFSHMTDGIEKGVSGEEVVRRLGEAVSKRNYKKLENGERWYYNFDLIVYMSNNKVDHYEFPGEENFKAKDDGKLLEGAYESYKETIKLDPKFFKIELNPQNAEIGLDRVAKFFYNNGVEFFQAKEIDKALYNFEFAEKIYEELGTKDDNLTLYTGYAAESLKDTATAIKYYTKLVDTKSDNANLYMSLAYLYIGSGNTDKALEVIKAGRAVLPDNQNLLLTEANIFLQSDNAKEAEIILKQAAARDPENAQLQFAIGANYDKMVNDSNSTPEAKQAAFESGKASYKKALELKPEYFDAAYNLGAMLNNKAAILITDANNLPLSETKKYDAKMKEATDLLLEAKPYLEKCHKLDPSDRNTMIMLRGIYQQTKDLENLKKINAELKK
jgi:Tfp pilus assembly protein PilF